MTVSVILILVMLLLSAFFSGMEIAFVSKNRLKLEIDRKQSGLLDFVAKVFERHPGQYITSILVGNNIALVVYSLYMSSLLRALAALAGCSTGEDNSLVSKTPFPEFSEADTEGNPVSSDIFADYDATIVNFWNNGCGTCIEEMPELEELYHQFQEQNINLIGVGTDSGEGEEQMETARNILTEKGVTYVNISPDPEGKFYQDFISEIFSYPTTYIVDGEGNVIGAPIIGNVKKQIDTVNERLALIQSE